MRNTQLFMILCSVEIFTEVSVHKLSTVTIMPEFVYKIHGILNCILISNTCKTWNLGKPIQILEFKVMFL